MTALVKHINSPSSSFAINNYNDLQRRIIGLTDGISKLNQNTKKYGAKLSVANFSIPTNTGHRYISLSDIVYCIAQGNYSRVFLLDRSSYLLSKTLKKVSASFMEIFSADIIRPISSRNNTSIRLVTIFAK